MKESMGGAFMLRLFLVIFILFFTFICISAVYARAFKTKNGVIDIIERYEGINNNSIPKIEEFIKKIGYSCSDNDPKYNSNIAHYVLKREYNSINKGFENNGSDGRYTIQVCVDWNVPIIHAQGTWVINAKTEIIKNVVNN